MSAAPCRAAAENTPRCLREEDRPPSTRNVPTHMHLCRWRLTRWRRGASVSLHVQSQHPEPCCSHGRDLPGARGQGSGVTHNEHRHCTEKACYLVPPGVPALREAVTQNHRWTRAHLHVVSPHSGLRERHSALFPNWISFTY